MVIDIEDGMREWLGLRRLHDGVVDAGVEQVANLPEIALRRQAQGRVSRRIGWSRLGRARGRIDGAEDLENCRVGIVRGTL